MRGDTSGAKRQRRVRTQARARVVACCVWLILCGSAASAQSLPEKSWETLQAGVNAQHKDERVAAVRALGLLQGDPLAAGLAEKALKDKKTRVRAAAAVALGQMGSTKSIPLLKEALADKEDRVYFAAANSLLLLGDSAGYDLYYEVLTGERKTGENCTTRYKRMFESPAELAYFGLGIGVGFIPYAGYPWAVLQIVAKNYGAPVEAEALRKLGADPDPRIGAALVKALSDKNTTVRVAALDAIARHGDTSLVSAVAPYISDKKAAVRFTAAAAVVRLSSLAPTECDTQGSIDLPLTTAPDFNELSLAKRR